MSQSSATNIKSFIHAVDFDYFETYAAPDNQPWKRMVDIDNTILHLAKQTHRIARTDDQARQFVEMLQSDQGEVQYWMCAPVYREAIIFYDKQNRIITALNICLTCSFMETNTARSVEAGNCTYEALKRYFMELGHYDKDPGLIEIESMKALRTPNR